MIALISLGKTVPALTSFHFTSLKVGIHRYWPTCSCGKGDFKKNPTKLKFKASKKKKKECFDDDIGKKKLQKQNEKHLKPEMEWQATPADLLRVCFKKQKHFLMPSMLCMS